MKTRIFISRLLLCLFCLFPRSVTAQQLTQFEYWFDGDFAGRTAVALSGSYDATTKDVATDQLSAGFHKLYLRAKRSDGMYSAINTSHFFKLPTGQTNGLLEYWFDDNYSQRKTFTLSATDGTEQGFELNLSDFQQGLHTLKMRVSAPLKGLSAIYSATVLKVSFNTVDRLEYWLDDDFAGRKTLTGTAASQGTLFLEDLDFSNLSTGVHRLSCRALNEGCTTATPITSALVLVHRGTGKTLEYWFDNDRSHVYTLAGKELDSQIAFAGNLVLDGVAPGHHRLYCRTVSSDGTTHGAITSEPIIVHSRYNVDGTQEKVVQYAFSVDNEERVVRNVLHPSYEIDLPYTYDASHLSVGDHTLKATFWNSLGAATTEVWPFNVAKVERPEIALTATEKDGLVTLQFNSVPNDVRYRVWRKAGEDEWRKVVSIQSSYPNAVQFVDNPVAGTYAYRIQAAYLDANGENQKFYSNEATVSVTASQESTAKLGGIVGRILFDGEQTAMVPMNLALDVKFSDGVTVRAQSNGMFRRDGIPVGTTLSMTIDNNAYYTFDRPTVTVSEESRNELCAIRATSVSEKPVQPENIGYELVITSPITGIPQAFNFTVKNESGSVWTGNIDLIAIRKKDDKGKGITYAATDSYYKVGTYAIRNLERGKSQDVSIQVTDFPSIKENTPFLFYIVSESNRAKGSYVPLQSSHADVTNPKELLMAANTQQDPDYSEFIVDEVDACIAEILSTMKTMDKIGGPLSAAIAEASDAISRYERDKDVEGLFGNLPDLLKMFSHDLKAAIKDVKDVTDAVGKVKKFYDTMNAFKDFQSADDFTKFMTLSKLVFEYSGLPFAQIYSTYFEVAKVCVDKIMAYQKQLYEIERSNSFYEDYIVFKIQVAKKDAWYRPEWSALPWMYFRGSDVASQIRNVNIHLCSYHSVVTGNNGVWAHGTYEPDFAASEYNAAVLRRVSRSGQNFMEPTQRFWAEIEWKNGRKSVVPLLYDDIVDIGGSRAKPVITVTFQSESSSVDSMADIIYLKPKEQ